MLTRTSGVRLNAEPLEAKLCLSASVGWDGPGQGSAELTYHVGDLPSTLDPDAVELALEEAFDAWAEVIDVTFTETTQAGSLDSIDITFEDLDGSGGTLALAYFPDDLNRPLIAGDIVFDSSEAWEVGNDQGNGAFDLVYVAVHEIGHALGLEHDDTVGSVLRDSVSPDQQFEGLDSSDIDAALELYAPAATTLDPAVEDAPLSPMPTESDPTAGEPETPPSSSEPPVTDPPPAEPPVAESPADEDELPAEDPPESREPWLGWRRWIVIRWHPWYDGPGRFDNHASNGGWWTALMRLRR